MKRILLALVTLSLLFGSTACHKHAYWDWYVEKEATCQEEGLKVRECSCGEKETKTIPKTEHTAGEWIIDTQPTLESTGKKHQVCAVCGETIATANIARLKASDLDGTDTEVAEVEDGHTHSGEWFVETEATCQAAGKRVYKCVLCGEVLDTEVIAKKAHDYVRSTNTGKTVYTCSVCGASYTVDDTIKPLAVTVEQTGFASVFEGSTLHHELTFTATATGGRGNIKYRFEIYKTKDASVATLTEDYSLNSTCVFESTSMDLTGLYVKVTAKDDNGTTAVATYVLE